MLVLPIGTRICACFEEIRCGTRYKMGDVEVNAELQSKAHKICKEFLGGTWAKLPCDDFEIERISGGLSNLLYLCSMPDKYDTKPGEQRQVMLRLYGQIIQENPETVVTDSVIFALLAEKQMGPKLYGVFTGGRVEEYIKSRHLYTLELHDSKISSACAQVMAKFHKLTVPLIKEPRWLFDTMTRYLDEALNNITFVHPDPDKREKLQKIMSFNLADELECLRHILDQVHSPVVFCHNDMQEGNILYFEETKGFQVMPIDFEYASYNYRGFDLGNHFCEWCYDYSVEESPYFSARIDQYPTKDQQLNFIRSYLEEMNPEGDYDPALEEEKLVLEANTYALASHFLWGLWSIVQSQISGIPFGYLDYALARFDAYFYQKKRLPSHIQVNGI